MGSLARLIVTVAAALTLAAAAPAAGKRPERIPAGVTAVDVRSSHGVSRRVTRPARVARIVRWFDALPRLRPSNVHYFCPLIRAGSPIVSFAFRAANGRVLGHAKVLDAFRGISGRCNPIFFSIGDRARTPLVGGRFLLRVQRLLGVRFR